MVLRSSVNAACTLVYKQHFLMYLSGNEFNVLCKDFDVIDGVFNKRA